MESLYYMYYVIKVLKFFEYIFNDVCLILEKLCYFKYLHSFSSIRILNFINVQEFFYLINKKKRIKSDNTSKDNIFVVYGNE